MTNRLGIENLTLMGMPPIQYVELAAELGCVGVSLGLMSMPFERFGFKDVNLYPEWSLVDDLALRREFKAALADTRIAISLGEGFRADPSLDVSEKAEWLDILADLGGQRINAVSIESNRSRTIDQLGKLADMTIARGMQFTVEFAPPNAINSLTDAISVAAAIGGGKAKVLIDSMHFYRSGSRTEELAAIDPALIGYAQLCDAPWEPVDGKPYLMESTFGRSVPGEGEFPLHDWVAALPADLHIGIEAPALADLMEGLSPREHAARVVSAARALGA
ncbi:TIM barrel protein [Novosphingobium sp.]|uniref:sugar phosphate isomerase/epimerase family protein n=1 Tax=Novosphingobium sp. TaxID=1874826 RepID=UPI00286DB64C|nr:TIM barrel protein [Novosphingobium sp.]